MTGGETSRYLSTPEHNTQSTFTEVSPVSVAEVSEAHLPPSCLFLFPIAVSLPLGVQQ